MTIARYVAFPLGAAAGGAIVATSAPARRCCSTRRRTHERRAPVTACSVAVAARTGGARTSSRSCATAGVRSREHTWVCLLDGLDLALLPDHVRAVLRAWPDVAKESLGGAAPWAAVVTGEAIGSLAGGSPPCGCGRHGARS